MKNKLCMLLLATGIGLFSCAEKELPKEYTDSVNVFIGTGGHGHTFPGATLPHGMVQLSPDTRLFGWDACSGYYYDDTSIMGFSHTHLSGTGIGDYGDILFMPVVGEKPLIAGTAENPDEGYRSRFSHEQESARPGYYQVLLQDDSINVELTATLRAGLQRYTYPKASDARLIVDMEPTIHGHQHPVTQIRVVNDSTIAGMKYTVGWAKRHYVYFYAVFSSPFDYKLYSGTEYQSDSTSVTVNTAKAVIRFKNLPVDGRVLAKVGISSVDEEGARLNVEAEIPNWNFEGVMKEANTAWNEALGKIDIETSDNDSRTVFYTSLYHAFIQPSLASDVDGRYRTMGHEIKQDASYTNYTVFSLWDTFRAAHPLYTIVTPEQNQAFIRSLLRKYDEGGILPKWELASNETGTMIGYHAVSVIADAMMKKQCDFDVKKALEACIRSSVYDTMGVTPMMDRQILNGKLMPVSIKYKNELGYIPCDKVGGSVSQGLEFAYNDWLIAQMMKEHNRKDLYDKYMELSRNYRNYFDPETKLMRGRLSDGSWITPFDPASVQRPSNYVEGNAWQWAWFVPQDVEGLMELVGGQKSFEAHLDTLFTTSSELTGDPNAAADVTGMIGQYAHGNEPSHHIPYLYNYAGAPRKTQALVDHILRTLYHNDPNGLSGNEDVGQMSAWYALSAMGFYSFCPGRPVYEIGRPMFDKVTIHLSNGKDFIIQAKNNSVENKYIRSMKLNGEKLAEPRFSHFDLMKGGELIFEMEN
ncbi:GH92 family glycosyl hydrolase [Bacteroides intestinalis]|jgi:predicted alpha-1,2-mannosidase|uniref:Glycoside hydrolase family 92 protein n=1 Tax=Bacteroides intestinalis TaxID=329854 RepID=A0AAQ0LIS4_9BACE|nr:GH92 family glycosyl hydrolase [Bacteroides intestinalis]QDO69003.1 glycoside hydrolase family 92 protein [Bacteroides intestinalis]RGT44300.1 glycoside hydrolase family 92 protein [Bacteroides intestinalis]RGX84163.1 glycoside hydrolase family 92 protein [Bacteroides intestinalis]RHN06701.1 glycoside hydrolase family 92 protein [Bacteroides intestinalis]UCB37230.1 GH92 family glycosyl hydrolase [Bacteroides intestinalis]